MARSKATGFERRKINHIGKVHPRVMPLKVAYEYSILSVNNRYMDLTTHTSKAYYSTYYAASSRQSRYGV
jgi:hypothetical protein